MMTRHFLWVALLLLGRAVPCHGATTIVAHHGNANPTTEGWTANVVGTGVAAGPVTDDLGSGINAWFVDDNNGSSSGVISYIYSVSGAVVSSAAAQGWRLSAYVRVVDANLPVTPFYNFANYAAYHDSALRYSMIFGDDASGNAVVKLVTGGTAISGTPVAVGPSYSVGAPGYHLYELVYDPSAGSSDLFVDGVERISDYSGQALASSAMVVFGSGDTQATGQGNYNLVSFELVPEPSVAGLTTLGLCAALCRRRRAHGALPADWRW